MSETTSSISVIRAAYLGPEGTFSYFAALEYLCTDLHTEEKNTRFELVACPDFNAIFESVTTGACEIGVVPLENSLRGTVGQSFDLFLSHDVTIIAELYASISHCLLARNINSIDEVKVVYSHPQPLAQCDNWIRTSLKDVPVVAMESTAAAAARAFRERGAAAVGHWRLGELFGMNILARAIEDEADNWTRFVVIDRDGSLSRAMPAQDETQRRTSLLFILRDNPGSLAAVLNTLAAGGINMRKLESRPFRQPGGENWKYAFFVDVESDLSEPAHAGTMARLQENCEKLQLLGSYSQGPYLTTHLKHSE